MSWEHDEAALHERRMTELCARDVEIQRMRPSILLRPALSIDGDKWCALHGVNLMEGVAGFGDSPAEAYADFDAQWVAKLPTRKL